MPPLVRLIQYAKPYRLRLLGASISAVLNTIADLLPDVLIGLALDVVVKQRGSWLATLGVIDVKTQLLVLTSAAFVMWLISSLTEYLYIYLWRTLSQDLQHALRIDTYAHVQRLEMTYHEDETTGNVLSIINDDINQLERFLDYGAYKFIYLVTSLTMVSGTFFYLSPTIALCALLPVPFILVTVWWFRKQLAPRYARIRMQVGQVADRVTNNIMGMMTIKSYTNEQFELERMRGVSNAYRQASYEAIVYNAAFFPVVRIIIVLAFIATVLLGGWQVLEGLLDVGAYSVMVFQVQKILWPAIELVDLVDLYERSMASVKRIFGLLDTPSVRSTGSSLPIAQVKGQIEFKHIVFGYASGQPLFKNLSFSIEPGSTVAFVGATGSGKSTILKLLLRFYEINQGSITLDGHDIRDLSLHDLRHAIAVVSQDVFLFNGTIEENIAYGKLNASRHEVIEAAKVAEAHEFIDQLPFGYDTLIGERGIKLSGGQRQRISIARAVLKNAPILIFDEATSSVDHETEAVIQRSLERITQFHTVIIISHRISTITKVDRIFVIEKGTIAQIGKHHELLQVPGVYSELWQAQAQEL